MNILEKMTMVALGVCSVGSLVGCGDNGAVVEPDGTGQIGLSLQRELHHHRAHGVQPDRYH